MRSVASFLTLLLLSAGIYSFSTTCKKGPEMHDDQCCPPVSEKTVSAWEEACCTFQVGPVSDPTILQTVQSDPIPTHVLAVWPTPAAIEVASFVRMIPVFSGLGPPTPLFLQNQSFRI